MTETLEKDEVVIREIIAGARTLFEKFGLKKTTMEEIAREVGKGKSSLYYYFQSKFEIFEAVIDQEITELFSLARKAIDKAGSAKEKLKAYGKIRLCKIHELGNLSQVVRNDLMDNMNVVMNLKMKHEARQVDMIRKIIADGVASGEFKNLNEGDIHLLAVIFTATFRGIALPFCGEHKFPDLTKSLDTIIDVMVEGIGN